MKPVHKTFQNKWPISLLLLMGTLGLAQQPMELELETCQMWARQHYPLIKEHALLERSREYSLANVVSRALPQVRVSGHATYQSEVTQLPLNLPGMEVPQMAKQQYGLWAEVSQSITGLFTLGDQKENVNSRSSVESLGTEVELNQVRQRINELYFGILLLDRQLEQNALVKERLAHGIQQTEVAIANGVALKSAANILKAELLKADQRTIEVRATRAGHVDRLSLFIGKPISDGTILHAPLAHEVPETINRIELQWYDQREMTLKAQSKLLAAKNLPQFEVFFRGGYGRPGLDMLDNEFQGYAMGGLRMNWDLGHLYTFGKEKKILENERDLVGIQREVFLHNTQLSLRQLDAQRDKLRQLIQSDRQIVTVRENITETLGEQLQYGTATPLDYITAVTEEDLAKQQMLIHGTQLLLTTYQKREITGIGQRNKGLK